jgi:hypothetical protein
MRRPLNLGGLVNAVQLMDWEIVAVITNDRLDFDPWEQIFYGGFDGDRRKRVLVKIIGEQVVRPPMFYGLNALPIR